MSYFFVGLACFVIGFLLGTREADCSCNINEYCQNSGCHLNETQGDCAHYDGMCCDPDDPDGCWCLAGAKEATQDTENGNNLQKS